MPLFSIKQDRVIYERESRNTFENAQRSMELLKPKREEKWILVTSAFHMPRAMGVFRKQLWNVLAYPVDFETPARARLRPRFNILQGLQETSKASHECIGLIIYWLTGRTTAPFPGP